MQTDVAEPVLQLDPAVMIVPTEKGVRIVGRGIRYALNGRAAREMYEPMRTHLERGSSRSALLGAVSPSQRDDAASYLEGLEAAGAFGSVPAPPADVIGLEPLESKVARVAGIEEQSVRRAVFRMSANESTSLGEAAPSVWFVAEPAHRPTLLALERLCKDSRVVVLVDSDPNDDELLKRLARVLAAVGLRTGGALYRFTPERSTVERLFEVGGGDAAFQLGICAPATCAQAPLASFEAGHPVLGPALVRSAITPVLAERAAIAALVGPLAHPRSEGVGVSYALSEQRAQLRAVERALLNRAQQASVPMERIDLLSERTPSDVSAQGPKPSVSVHLADCLRSQSNTLPAWRGTGPGGLHLIRWQGAMFGSVSSETVRARALAFACAAAFSSRRPAPDEVAIDVEDIEGTHVALRHMATVEEVFGLDRLHTAQATLWGVAVDAAWVGRDTDTNASAPE